MPTKIQWVINSDGTPGETINPLIGCKRKCSYCYASRQAQRLLRFPHTKDRYTGLVEDGRWTGTVGFVLSELTKLDRWKKPRSVFIGSMGDVGDSDAGAFSLTMEAVDRNPRHNCMVLTKNPLRLGLMIGGYLGSREPLPNLMVGATVTDQPSADKMIPLLLDIRAARRFVSVEPMLDWVQLNGCRRCNGTGTITVSGYPGEDCCPDCDGGPLAAPGGDGINWVIVGAQTGKNKRPMDLAWARSIKEQCTSASVPFFMKAVSSGQTPPDLLIREYP